MASWKRNPGLKIPGKGHNKGKGLGPGTGSGLFKDPKKDPRGCGMVKEAAEVS